MAKIEFEKLPLSHYYDYYSMMGALDDALFGRNGNGVTLKLAKETLLFAKNGAIVLRHYSTDLLIFEQDNTVTLHGGPDRTATSKHHINAVLYGNSHTRSQHVYLSVGQVNFQWFLFRRYPGFDQQEKFPFFDGMRVNLATGDVVNAEDSAGEYWRAA